MSEIKLPPPLPRQRLTPPPNHGGKPSIPPNFLKKKELSDNHLVLIGVAVIAFLILLGGIFLLTNSKDEKAIEYPEEAEVIGEVEPVEIYDDNVIEVVDDYYDGGIYDGGVEEEPMEVQEWAGEVVWDETAKEYIHKLKVE